MPQPASRKRAFRGGFRCFKISSMHMLLKHLNPPRKALFLDAGCGIGDHSLRIADRGYRCWGVDLSEAVLKTARNNAALRGLASRTSFECQALEDLTFD